MIGSVGGVKDKFDIGPRISRRLTKDGLPTCITGSAAFGQHSGELFGNSCDTKSQSRRNF